VRLNRNRPTKQQVHRLLLVDDHPILREGFAHLIEREADLKVCGHADNLAGAVSAVGQHKPDLLILEIALKGDNGLDVLKTIKSSYPELPVMVLSVLDETLFAERAVRAGARGYVMKQAPTEEVMAAIRKVLHGGRYLSGKMQERMIENLANGAANHGAPALERLSNRELEVFQLVGRGCGTRQIAEQLRLSVKTIETYRAHIKEKLNLRTGMELIRTAIKCATEKERF